jgi:hypothetical protein
MEVRGMKRYSVYILFSNGEDIQFETDTDMNNAPTKTVNGVTFRVTENEYAINMDHVKEINVVRLR